MSKEKSDIESILIFMDRYCSLIIEGFRERWKKWDIEIYDSETFEAIGGLLSRQVTLSIGLASATR